jgi:hypothetical protein
MNLTSIITVVLSLTTYRIWSQVNILIICVPAIKVMQALITVALFQCISFFTSFTPYNFHFRRGWVVSVAPAALYLRYLLDRILDGPQSWSDQNTEARGKILCLCRWPNPSCPVCTQMQYWPSYTTKLWTTWKQHNGKKFFTHVLYDLNLLPSHPPLQRCQTSLQSCPRFIPTLVTLVRSLNTALPTDGLNNFFYRSSMTILM